MPRIKKTWRQNLSLDTIKRNCTLVCHDLISAFHISLGAAQTPHHISNKLQLALHNLLQWESPIPDHANYTRNFPKNELLDNPELANYPFTFGSHAKLKQNKKINLPEGIIKHIQLDRMPRRVRIPTSFLRHFSLGQQLARRIPY